MIMVSHPLNDTTGFIIESMIEMFVCVNAYFVSYCYLKRQIFYNVIKLYYQYRQS